MEAVCGPGFQQMLNERREARNKRLAGLSEEELNNLAQAEVDLISSHRS